MAEKDFQTFREFVRVTIHVVSLDLDQLKIIADHGNDITNSASTTTQTTKAPGDDTPTFEQPIFVSRCTIPIAMVCFAFIDMVGQWVNTYKDDDFGHSSSDFFKKLADKDDLISDTTFNKFKEEFRHSIMHGFFANPGFSVSYTTFDGNSLFLDIHDNGGTLDVRYLLSIVRMAMSKIELELMDESTNLSQELFKGYQRWLNKK